MIVNESRIGRRLVVLLHRGEEVSATLRRLCERENIRSAWVRGRGVLEWAELAEWDAEREAFTRARRVEGPLTVASMDGNVSIRLGPIDLQLSAALSRQRGDVIEVVGGNLVAASALGLELAIDTYEDVRLERAEDAASGLLLWKGEVLPGVTAHRAEDAREARPRRAVSTAAEAPAAPPPPPPPPPPPRASAPEPEPEPAPSAAAGISWADVAAASAAPEPTTPVSDKERRMKKAAAILDEPYPEKGDWVDHRQFGLCKVEGEDTEGGVRIRLPSGVRKVIRLDFLEVLPARVEGDRKIFPLRPRRR